MPLLILISILATYLSLAGMLDQVRANLQVNALTVYALMALTLLPVLLFAGSRIKQSIKQFSATAIWFATVVFLIVSTQWLGWISELFPDSMSLQFLFASAPSVFSLAGIWWVESKHEGFDIRQSWNAMICRLKVQVFTIAIPLTVILLIQDICNQGVANSPLAEIGLFLLGFLCLSLAMPKLVTWILPTERICHTELGKELNEVASLTKTRIQEIRIWGTGDRMINALVVGIFSVTRAVLLSDRLIKNFEMDEIKSVFLHELGHAKRQHLLKRFAAAGIPFLFTQAIGVVCGLDPTITLLLSFAFSLLGFTVVARFLEYDADQFALEQLSVMGISPAVYQSALLKILAENPQADRNSWLHPRISERIRRVAQTIPVELANRNSGFSENSIRKPSRQFPTTRTT